MDKTNTSRSAIVRLLGEHDMRSSQPGKNPGNYRAVAIAPGARACETAKRFSNHRFLLDDAPKTPLAGCDLGGSCACMYRKFADRRSDYRRSIDEGIPDFGMFVMERRKGADRRAGR